MSKITRMKYAGAAAVLLLACFQFNFFDGGKVNATVPYAHSRVNLTSGGSQANNDSESGTWVTMSQDGRYVAFQSHASNLVAGDTNGQPDIFVKDTQTNAISLVNVNSSGVQTSVNVQFGKISSDGRYVAFSAPDNSLIAGDNNGKYDVFVRDMQTGSIEIVSKSTAGTLGNNHSASNNFDISANGRFIVFESNATNLVPGDTNGFVDVFVRDRDLDTTTRLSVSNLGAESDGLSFNPSISCDGSRVAFESSASNLVTGGGSGHLDIYVVDRIGGHDIQDITPTANDYSGGGVVSCDGSTVVFSSPATNLVSGDTNGRSDIFAYDTGGGTTTRVSVSAGGAQADYGADWYAVSANGKYVAFESYSTNLDGTESGSPDGDIFLRSITSNTTERISKRDAVTDMTYNAYAASVTISDDGTKLGFLGSDTGLVSGDTNGYVDVFISSTGNPACKL